MNILQKLFPSFFDVVPSEPMKLILGLGNYPPKYTKTRHNVGFLFLDYLQKKYDGSSFSLKKNLRSEISEVFIDGQKYLLAKPQTYMNLSGESLGLLMGYYKLSKEDIVVVYDDIDMEFAKIRFRATGRSGGHNGIKSIIKTLGGDVFARIKIGVSNEWRAKVPAEDFVLQSFLGEELQALSDVFTETEKVLASN